MLDIRMKCYNDNTTNVYSIDGTERECSHGLLRAIRDEKGRITDLCYLSVVYDDEFNECRKKKYSDIINEELLKENERKNKYKKEITIKYLNLGKESLNVLNSLKDLKDIPDLETTFMMAQDQEGEVEPVMRLGRTYTKKDIEIGKIRSQMFADLEKRLCMTNGIDPAQATKEQIRKLMYDYKRTPEGQLEIETINWMAYTYAGYEFDKVYDWDKILAEEDEEIRREKEAEKIKNYKTERSIRNEMEPEKEQETKAKLNQKEKEKAHQLFYGNFYKNKNKENIQTEAAKTKAKMQL